MHAHLYGQIQNLNNKRTRTLIRLNIIALLCRLQYKESTIMVLICVGSQGGTFPMLTAIPSIRILFSGWYNNIIIALV